QQQQQDAGQAGGAPDSGGASGGPGSAGASGGPGGSTGSSGSSGASGGTGDGGPSGGPSATGTWGANDQQLLNQALNSNVDFDNVFDWGQGQEGNCAAVAVIKAAMDVYDNQVFDKVEQTPDGGYRITMQDGVTVELSKDELSQAADASNFSGPDSASKSYATLAYAAMAKRAQMEGHEGARNYTQALNNIANGDNPYDSARFLGLKNQTQSVDPTKAQGGNAVVGWNSKHAVYTDTTSSGTRTDHYGETRSYDGTDTRGRGLSYGFTFKPRESSSSSSSSGGATSNAATRTSSPGEGASTPSSSRSTSSSSSGGSSSGGSSSSRSSGSSSSSKSSSSKKS
ncbi:MAG: hypothetical protein AB1758_12125, partial [Candidatus Eremiobacterota bacterium]